VRVGPHPHARRSLFARAENHGRIPLSTVCHGLNSSRPAALKGRLVQATWSTSLLLEDPEAGLEQNGLTALFERDLVERMDARGQIQQREG